MILLALLLILLILAALVIALRLKPKMTLPPNARLIALPVKRIHADSDSPLDPVVYFGGGPGMSNMRFDPPDELREVQPTDVETLLISGSIDFSTPAEYARDELQPSLKNGKQVIICEVGHAGDVWNVQPEATLRLQFVPKLSYT